VCLKTFKIHYHIILSLKTIHAHVYHLGHPQFNGQTPLILRRVNEESFLAIHYISLSLVSSSDKVHECGPASWHEVLAGTCSPNWHAGVVKGENRISSVHACSWTGWSAVLIQY
jgi:hypothetical protein